MTENPQMILKAIFNAVLDVKSEKPQYPSLIPNFNFDKWSELNEIELKCIAAESGADREMCFNKERFEEDIFENDIRNFKEE